MLLDVFAAVRREIPGTRLMEGRRRRSAASMPGAGRATGRGRRDRDHCRIFDPKFPATAILAAVYRRAQLTLFPSDAEGFGLPVAESMACGTPVLVSDIPVLPRGRRHRRPLRPRRRRPVLDHQGPRTPRLASLRRTPRRRPAMVLPLPLDDPRRQAGGDLSVALRMSEPAILLETITAGGRYILKRRADRSNGIAGGAIDDHASELRISRS